MPRNLTNARQYGKTLRVEFTLTKLQEDHSEQGSLRKITLAHKIIKKKQNEKQEKQLNKRSLISDKISQSNQHTKALQKLSKLTTSSGSRLYGNISTDSDNFYYFLEGWAYPFFDLLLSLSRTSQLKIQKLCHNPTKATKCPRPSKQLMTSQCNRNTYTP